MRTNADETVLFLAVALLETCTPMIRPVHSCRPDLSTWRYRFKVKTIGNPVQLCLSACVPAMAGGENNAAKHASRR